MDLFITVSIVMGVLTALISYLTLDYSTSPPGFSPLGVKAISAYLFIFIFSLIKIRLGNTLRDNELRNLIRAEIRQRGRIMEIRRREEERRQHEIHIQMREESSDDDEEELLEEIALVEADAGHEWEWQEIRRHWFRDEERGRG